MSASMGALAQFGIDASSSTVTTKYELVGGDIGLQEEFIDQEGIIGTRTHMADRVRQNTRRVTGMVTLRPNSVELDVWLPLILGGTEVADVFPFAETTPTFYVSVDRVIKVLTYSGCVVSKAVFRATQGQPLELDIYIEGVDETVGNAGTFPSLSVSTVGPYIFSDAVITVNSQALKWRDFQLEIDNVVDTERFFNNQTRQSIPAKDRIVTWTLNGPYGDNYAAYNTGAAGVSAQVVFTNGNRSLTLSSSKVQTPRQSPLLNGKEEIMIPWVGVARASSGTAGGELTVTNDSTG